MIRGLGRYDAFDLALPEVGAALREAARDPVRHERRRRRPTGRDTHPAANRGRSQERPPVAWHLQHCTPDRAHVDTCMDSVEFETLFDRDENLTDPEQTDDRDEEWYAPNQLVAAERESYLARDRVHPDR